MIHERLTICTTITVIARPSSKPSKEQEEIAPDIASGPFAEFFAPLQYG